MYIAKVGGIITSLMMCMVLGKFGFILSSYFNFDGCLCCYFALGYVWCVYLHPIRWFLIVLLK